MTIEVVDGLEGHEPEKGFRKESKPSWASPNWRNWWPRTSSSSSSSSSTHQTGVRDRSYGGKTADSNFLRPPADWDRKGSKTQTEYGEIDGRGKEMHISAALLPSLLQSEVESVIYRFRHRDKWKHHRHGFWKPLIEAFKLFYERYSSALQGYRTVLSPTSIIF